MGVNIYFIGTAGSGKTYLTFAFQTWMHLNGYDAITVNLDPGVEHLPYSADIDIREWINLKEVMEEYGVGPNGAQIIAADLLALKIEEVKKEINTFETDYILFDTPGQIELFTLRDTSRLVIQILGGNSMIAFLYDPILAATPTGFVSLLMQAASVQFRLTQPFTNLLAKADLISQEKVEEILGWSQDSFKLFDALMKEKITMRGQLSLQLFKALEELGAYKALIPISSEINLGMEDLYNACQQVFYGGEDLSK